MSAVSSGKTATASIPLCVASSGMTGSGVTMKMDGIDEMDEVTVSAAARLSMGFCYSAANVKSCGA